MRRGGSGARIFRHVPSIRLNKSKNLFCAVIRGDAVASRHVLTHESFEWSLEFLGLLQDNGFAGFALSSFGQMGLLELVKTVQLPCTADSGKKAFGALFSNSLFESLQRIAFFEQEHHEAFSKKLAKVASHLSTAGVRVLWTKGNGLANVIYDEPFFRKSSDFDITLRPADAEKLHQALLEIGYRPIDNDPGFCHQLEVGPCNSFRELFAVPCRELVPSAVIGYAKDNWPVIDVKFNPLDRGLSSKDIEVYYAAPSKVAVVDALLLVPGTIEHLLISIIHAEKDRFESWKSLVDIHLLCCVIERNGEWERFEQRVILEGASLSAWAALSMITDRFLTPIPSDLISRLAPSKKPFLTSLAFCVDPMFSWNGPSLFMLFLNAVYTGDSTRKLNVLKQCLTGNRDFRVIYYGRVAPPHVMVHLLIFLLPALVIRKWFGRYFWPGDNQYSQLPAAARTSI